MPLQCVHAHSVDLTLGRLGPLVESSTTVSGNAQHRRKIGDKLKKDMDESSESGVGIFRSQIVLGGFRNRWCGAQAQPL